MYSEGIWEKNVILLWQWEHLVRKVTDFSNHRRFSLMCLTAGITPVSVTLINTVSILTSTYIGTTITICQPSIVCLTSSHIGLGQFVLPPSCSLRRGNTLERLYPGVNTPHGLSIDSRLETALNTGIHRSHAGSGTTTTTLITPTATTTASIW